MLLNHLRVSEERIPPKIVLFLNYYMVIIISYYYYILSLAKTISQKNLTTIQRDAIMSSYVFLCFT